MTCRYDDEEVEWIDSSTEQYEFINFSQSQSQSQLPNSMPTQPITPVKEVISISSASSSPVASSPVATTPVTLNSGLPSSSPSTLQTCTSNIPQTPEKSQTPSISTSTSTSKITPRTRTFPFHISYRNRSQIAETID